MGRHHQQARVRKNSNGVALDSPLLRIFRNTIRDVESSLIPPFWILWIHDGPLHDRPLTLTCFNQRSPETVEERIAL